MSQALLELLQWAELPADAAARTVIEGADPVFGTRYRIADLGAASIAAAAIAADRLWTLRTGRRQAISVPARAAAVALRSNHYLKIDGSTPPRPTDKVTGFYPVRDGRWIYLHCNFPNLRDRNLGVLRAAANPAAVAAAVAQWDGIALEEAVAASGGCAAFVRSEDEWAATPQAAAVAAEPLLTIERIGDAPAEPLPPGDRPLSGLRALDLTRVLAGPTCARTLAEHGADVMRVSREGLPDSGLFDLDTGLGKLSTYIDLREPAGVEQLRALVRGADVFSQSYRPGSLDARGFSPQDLAQWRPGIVYVTLSAWGYSGPWRQRRGYDTVVQSANGLAWRGPDQRPAFLPVSAQDYIAGYLMAYGAMTALERRAREGGSWLVRISLAGTGHWLRRYGLLDPAAVAGLPADLPADELRNYLMESDSPVGRLTHLAPVARLSETPARWTRPAVPLGAHPPAWPA
ncbi:CoA transferase [Bordetella sp. BOR01]|uniref:CoA transferase n=1 Tax=Bordetella sp. BOR01 TaxID=2854779 RepID=UPI001C4421BA|nr:CoA transferase [Bordetella sp. BOR01]MBV7482200.1 CoA transferase [Bordetella sp. BOR01]